MKRPSSDSESLAVEDLELQSYHDGELDPARRLQVEARIASDTNSASRLQAWREIDQRLHQRFDPILTEPGNTFPTTAVSAPRASGALMRFACVAAIAGLMSVSGWVGWSLNPAARTSSQGAEGNIEVSLVAPALFAHRIYTEDPGRPVEVSALQQVSLNHWVSQRMHTPLAAPDLSKHGLTLIGGRLLPSTDRMAAQFMYEAPDASRVTVYVRRISEGGRAEFRYHERDDLHAFYWIDDNMGYAVVGVQPASELISLAGAVQRSFIRDAGGH